MAATVTWTIRYLGVLSIAEFFALIGFVWGFLGGLIILASYVQAYLGSSDMTQLQAGLFSFGLMIVYGIVGGLIGGSVIALAYNRLLGPGHGIRVKMDKE